MPMQLDLRAVAGLQNATVPLVHALAIQLLHICAGSDADDVGLVSNCPVLRVHEVLMECFLKRL